ncbi:MAG: flagellar hook-basal body complex protein FliE [Rhodospirillaceae bacterium]|nr:flagellar hook-basal body complex protein FliE [Rhodospirillaceae bacterium]
MNISFPAGAAAYANAARAYGGDPAAKTPGVEPGGAAAGGGFKEALEAAGQQAIDALKAGEQASLEAVTGKAQLSDVVTAVTNAEVTLQTVVAVRDKVVQAYQDILRMPI